MDVWRITVTVLRRWYVFLPLLALTALVALRVGESITPEYEVSATAILVPGSASTDIEDPYGSRSDTAQVLAIVMDSTASRDLIEQQGLDREYEFRSRDRSPILNLTVLSETSEESMATGQAVLDLAREELANRQSGAGLPPDAQISLQILQAPHVSDVVAEGKMRNMAVIGIIGAALSLLVAVLFDDLMGLFKQWVNRWRERRATRGTTRGTDETSAGTEATTGATPLDDRDNEDDHAAARAGRPSRSGSPRQSRNLERAGEHR